MENYYSDHGKKILDLIIGFGGSIIVGMMLLFSNGYSNDTFFINLGLFILIQGVAIVISFVKHRKFIGIGVMISWIIPVVLLLLLIGTCGNFMS